MGNNVNVIKVKQQKIEIVSFVLMGCLILGAFLLKLVPVLVSGLLIYLMVTNIFYSLEKNFEINANRLTVLILALIVSSIISLITLLVINSISYGSDGLSDLTNETFRIMGELKSYLPRNLVKFIPQDMIVLKERIMDILKENVANIFSLTANSFKGITQTLVGIVVGAIIAFYEVDGKYNNNKPLAKLLLIRIKVFKNCFSKLIISQIKISILNTILTAIYLLILLPFFDVNMPYTGTLLVVTFICGLLPVIGGIISNSLIIVLSLTINIQVVIASIIFLIVINMLEYYANAKIVGGEMNTSMWEVLVAMLVMEVLFGIWGVVLAPVIYGYIKQELKNKHLV